MFAARHGLQKVGGQGAGRTMLPSGPFSPLTSLGDHLHSAIEI